MTEYNKAHNSLFYARRYMGDAETEMNQDKPLEALWNLNVVITNVAEAMDEILSQIN